MTYNVFSGTLSLALVGVTPFSGWCHPGRSPPPPPLLTPLPYAV